jgi:hypothetical protein
MLSKGDARMDPVIETALRNLAQACPPRVFADGTVWEVSRSFFRSGSLDEAKLQFLRTLLQCYGQACLVLGDFDQGVEHELVQLGANAGSLEGVWMITSDADVVRLDRVSLYLGNWHLFTSAEPTAAARAVSSERTMDPEHLAEIATRNGIRAMVASDTDDDRWLLFLDGLEQVDLRAP